MTSDPELHRLAQEVCDYLLKGEGMTLMADNPGTRYSLLNRGWPAEAVDAGIALAIERHPAAPSTGPS